MEKPVTGTERRQAAVPFPLHALPGPLHGLAKAASSAFGFPPEFVVVPGLSVLAAAIGGRAQLEVTPGFTARSILWTAVSGPSGSAKTPARDLAVAPLVALEREWREGHAGLLADYAVQVAALAKGVPEPKPPIRRRALISDSTIEALGQVLLERPWAGFLWEHAELAAIIGGLDAYRAGGQGAGRAIFLALHDGADVRVDRVGRGSIYVPNPLVSVSGATQPERLQAVLAGADGLAPRFLIFEVADAPLALPHLRHRLAPEVTVAWENQVRELLLEPGSPIPPNYSEPAIYRLGCGGETAWRDAMARLQEVSSRGDVSALGQAAIGKGATHIATLALIFHLADSPSAAPAEVSGEVIERATALVMAAIDQVLRLDPGQPSAAADLRTRRLDEGVVILATWVRRRAGGCARAKDVVRGHVAGCRTGQEAAALLHRYEDVYPGCVVRGRLPGASSGRTGWIVYAPERAPMGAIGATVIDPAESADGFVRSRSEVTDLPRIFRGDTGLAPMAPIGTHWSEPADSTEGMDPLPMAALEIGPDVDGCWRP